MIALGDMEEALNKEIWYVTQDSRETKEGVLFVARVGEVRDGHDFLPQCFANGVTALPFSEGGGTHEWGDCASGSRYGEGAA